jgi:hypothetical protein
LAASDLEWFQQHPREVFPLSFYIVMLSSVRSCRTTITLNERIYKAKHDLKTMQTGDATYPGPAKLGEGAWLNNTLHERLVVGEWVVERQVATKEKYS